MYVLLFWPNLVCVEFHVYGFHFGVLVFFVVLYFFLCLICFVQVFLSFCVFGKFNLFIGFGFVFGLFSGQTRIFGSVYSQTNDFGSTQSGQLGWVKKIWAKGFIPYLVCHFFFVKGLSVKGFWQIPFRSILVSFITKQNGFLPNKT